MKAKFIFLLLLCLLFSACQKAQETIDDANDLTQSESPVTNPTMKEVEAAKSPCDEAANAPEAENCARAEFEKIDAEMNRLYQKIIADFQNLEQKARLQDKILADKYRKNADNLQTAQKAWTTFRDADCAAEKSLNATAENDAFVELNCRQRLTEDRLEDLKATYQNQ